MNRTYTFPVIVLLLFLFPCSAAYAFEGPLQVNNLYPLFLHANTPYLEKAEPENSMSFGISHSSTFTVKNSPEWDIGIDLEITEINFRYKRMVKDLFELDINIPVLIFGGGFMDGFLENYHNAFGFNDYGRSSRPHNEFLYEIKRNGNLIIKGKSGTAIGDITVGVKRELLSSDDYRLSIKGDIEVPVSDAEKGYSNGSLDAGISLLLDKPILDATMTYWNIGAVFPGDVRGHERVALHNYIFGGLAIETMVKKQLSLLVQLHGQSEIYPYTGISAIDGTALLIAFGGRYYTDNKSFELSLTEDLNTTGAPDFIINLTYKMHL